MEQRYFYTLNNGNLENHIAVNIEGTWFVKWTNHSLEEYKKIYSNQEFSQLYTWEEYELIVREHDKKHLIDPPAKEVDESRYWGMLEVLPPCRWHHYQGIELFHISERITGNIVSWVASLNGKYYEFAHYANASDEELAAKVLEVAK